MNDSVSQLETKKVGIFGISHTHTVGECRGRNEIEDKIEPISYNHKLEPCRCTTEGGHSDKRKITKKLEHIASLISTWELEVKY